MLRHRRSCSAVEGARDDLLLLLLRELDEAHGVAGDTHREVGVVKGVEKASKRMGSTVRR